MVRRGLAANRRQAQAAIATGRVLVGGAVADRPSRLVAASDPVECLGPAPPFVGRGGEKLAAAVEGFALSPDGATALDAGASTGGFTDCLLAHGARQVLAVDVGHGQLHPRLRADRRVVVFERTDVRSLTAGVLTAAAGPDAVPVDLVTADLSFISLTSAVPVLCGPVVRPGGSLVLLVKPQFEVGRADASRGRGVVRDPVLWRRSLGSVASSLRAATAVIIGAMCSPVTGAAGNAEFFLHASAPLVSSRPAAPGPTVGAMLDAAVDQAVAAAGRRAGRVRS